MRDDYPWDAAAAPRELDKACATNDDCTLASACYCEQRAVNRAERARLDAKHGGCPQVDPTAGPCPRFGAACRDRVCTSCVEGADCPAGDGGVEGGADAGDGG